MKPLWSIADLIDLECLHLHDENLIERNGQDELTRRDRDIYLQKIMPEVEGQVELTRSLLLHMWLKIRQYQEAEKSDGMFLPGRAWKELYVFFWFVLPLLGLISGAGLAFSFLSYSGSEPVNVIIYLGLFVGLQFLLYIFLGVAFFFRLKKRLNLNSSFLYSLLSKLMVSGMFRLSKYFGKKLTGQQRLQLSVVQGLIHEKLHTHGLCLFWPVFTLLQVLAIGFNLGVLGATFLKVISTDIAFGWQSTIRFSEQFIFTLVKFLALPWSWLVPENIAYPTLVHIHGSQVTLKEGIYHLATENLVSWWPFLCLAVFFYGLLPRMVLLLAGLESQRRSMGRLQFKGLACGQLIQRMTTSLISSQAPMAQPSARDHALGVHQSQESCDTQSIDADIQIAMYRAIALIPEELHGQCPLNTLQSLMLKRLGLTVQETMRIGESEQEDQFLFGQLEKSNSTSKIECIVVLQEAWQPPIAEFFNFLKRLRTTLSADVQLFVALIGKPTTDTIFTLIKKEDLKIWQQKIKAMGDPNIQVLELVVTP